MGKDVYQQDQGETITVNSIMWFSNSPDAGHPDCLCSWCGKPIPEGTVPLRVFDRTTEMEARFHNKCIAEASPVLGITFTYLGDDDEDEPSWEEECEEWDGAFNEAPEQSY
jgi:hypothetical protein